MIFLQCCIGAIFLAPAGVPFPYEPAVLSAKHQLSDFRGRGCRPPCEPLIVSEGRVVDESAAGLVPVPCMLSDACFRPEVPTVWCRTG